MEVLLQQRRQSLHTVEVGARYRPAHCLTPQPLDRGEHLVDVALDPLRRGVAIATGPLARRRPPRCTSPSPRSRACRPERIVALDLGDIGHPPPFHRKRVLAFAPHAVMMALDQVSLRSAKAPRALSLLAFDNH
jgi:hypothetical protein